MDPEDQPDSRTELDREPRSAAPDYAAVREDGVDTEGLGIGGLEDPVLVGRGGFATVYRAYQPAFRRTVAVKVLSVVEVDDLARERFRRECQAMGLLSEHPAIVTVLDAGFNEAGQPYLVMAYMPEGSLQDRLHRDGALGWQSACQIVVKIAGALQAAHDAGILHRDVKPANVLISQYGEPQLSDFGIARIAGGHETSSGVITASLSFAAPETIEGRRPAAASDIYSLAAMTYALASGLAPHSANGEGGLGSLIRSVLQDEPSDLTAFGVPDDVASVVLRGLAKDPAQRHTTVVEFGEALRDAQQRHGLRPTDLTVMRSAPPLPDPRPVADPVVADRTRDVEEVIAEATGQAAPAETSDNVAQSAEHEMADRVAVPPYRNRRVASLLALAVLILVTGVWIASLSGDPALTSVTAEELPPTDGGEADSSGDFEADDVALSLYQAGDRDGARTRFCDGREVVDFSGRDLRGVDLSNRSFVCADFSGSRLDGAELGGSDFTAADFSGASLINVTAVNPTQFDYVSFIGADLTGLSGREGVDMLYADFTDATLVDTDLGESPDVNEVIGAEVSGGQLVVLETGGADG